MFGENSFFQGSHTTSNFDLPKNFHPASTAWMLIHQGWDPSIVTKLHELHHLTPNFVHHHHLTSTFPFVVSCQHSSRFIYFQFFLIFKGNLQNLSKNHWKIPTLPPGLSRLNGTSSFMPRFGGSEAVRRKAVGSLNSHPYRMGQVAIWMEIQKKGGNPQKWMFEKNGKPYFLMDDLGGKPTIFGNIHIFSY